MRSIGVLFLLVCLVAAQDGGRDTGKEGKPVLFVRWQRLPETGVIYRACWSALEPYFGVLSRKRILDVDADPERGRSLLAAEKGAALVVAFDAESAKLVKDQLPNAALVLVGADQQALVPAQADRELLLRLMRLLKPKLRRVALFGDPSKLRDVTVKRCTKPAEMKDCDVVWIAEGAHIGARELRKYADKLGLPLVSTHPATKRGLAALHVRPDAAAVGRRTASVVLRHLRDAAPLKPQKNVRRSVVALDLGAADAAGCRVSLRLLARADTIGRTR
ncbi:MAG: hypothetical protein V3T86_07860 [Planctomycetota bacterium]